MIMKIKNEAGVFNARIGIWRGKESVFTYRNPKTGEVFGEDLGVLGRWVPADEVEFVD